MCELTKIEKIVGFLDVIAKWATVLNIILEENEETVKMLGGEEEIRKLIIEAHKDVKRALGGENEI